MEKRKLVPSRKYSSVCPRISLHEEDKEGDADGDDDNVTKLLSTAARLST